MLCPHECVNGLTRATMLVLFITDDAGHFSLSFSLLSLSAELILNLSYFLHTPYVRNAHRLMLIISNVHLDIGQLLCMNVQFFC